MTLEEFLLARYDEAEAKARDWWEATEDCPPYTVGGPVPDVVYVASSSGSQVPMPKDEFYARYMRRVEPDPFTIADLEAKRRIVGRYVRQAERARGLSGHASASKARDVLYPVIAELASTYADHPDYREEWRP